MEKHVFGGRYYSEYGAAFHDPLRAFLISECGGWVYLECLILNDHDIFIQQELFVIVPLNWDEWMAVLALSFPVIIIDEVLKLISVSVAGIRFLGFALSDAPISDTRQTLLLLDGRLHKVDVVDFRNLSDSF